MAKICTAKKGQHCKDCKWYQIDDDKSDYYGECRYSCCAVPNRLGYVNFVRKEEKE